MENKGNVVDFTGKLEEAKFTFISEDEGDLYDVDEKQMKKISAIDDLLAELELNPEAPEFRLVTDGFMRGSGNAVICLEVPFPIELTNGLVKDTVLKILRLSDFFYVANADDGVSVSIFITVYKVMNRKTN